MDCYELEAQCRKNCFFLQKKLKISGPFVATSINSYGPLSDIEKCCFSQVKRIHSDTQPTLSQRGVVQDKPCTDPHHEGDNLGQK